MPTPATWDRDTTDRRYTELVDARLRGGDVRPSMIAEPARADLEAEWIYDHPGHPVPRYIRNLGQPPDDELEPPDLDAEMSPVLLSATRSAVEVRQSFIVQSLVFPFAHWKEKGLDAVKAWAKRHGYHTAKVDTTSQSWRLRQRQPNEFQRLRTICVNPGNVDPGSDDCKVSAVGGPLKEE